MNLAEIKEQLSDMQRLVYTHIEPDMYESHVKYLLSIIEQAEKALKDISFITKYSDHITHKSAHNLSETALKSIQGDE